MCSALDGGGGLSAAAAAAAAAAPLPPREAAGRPQGARRPSEHGQGCSQAGRRRQVGVGGAGGRGGGCALALVGSRPPPRRPPGMPLAGLLPEQAGLDYWLSHGGQGPFGAGWLGHNNRKKLGDLSKGVFFWERGSILQKKRHTFFLLVSVGCPELWQFEKRNYAFTDDGQGISRARMNEQTNNERQRTGEMGGNSGAKNITKYGHC